MISERRGRRKETKDKKNKIFNKKFFEESLCKFVQNYIFLSKYFNKIGSNLKMLSKKSVYSFFKDQIRPIQNKKLQNK